MKSKMRACTVESTSYRLKCDEREHQVQVVSAQHSNRDSKQREGLFKDGGSCRKMWRSARRQVNHMHTTLTKYRFSLFSLVFLPWNREHHYSTYHKVMFLEGWDNPITITTTSTSRTTAYMTAGGQQSVGAPTAKDFGKTPIRPPATDLPVVPLTLSLHVLPLLPGMACPCLSSPLLA